MHAQIAVTKTRAARSRYLQGARLFGRRLVTQGKICITGTYLPISSELLRPTTPRFVVSRYRVPTGRVTGETRWEKTAGTVLACADDG
jgi:hypothetical protein